MWIIAYNFVAIYGIATKFGIMMCTYTTFLCTKFQGNLIMCLSFMENFKFWWKEEKQQNAKNKETQPIFEDLYLKNA